MLKTKDNIYLQTNTLYRQYRDGTGVLYSLAVRKKRKPKEDITENLKKRKKKIARVYKPDRKKIRSASIDLFYKKKSKCLLFLTFTFPGSPDELTCSKVWEQVLHSLRETFKINGYVWVKEWQKRGVIHYHIIVDKSYIKITKLQATFNRICYHHGLPCSNNSVHLGDHARIYEIKRVRNYLAKYLSKGENDIERVGIFASRCYGFPEWITLFFTKSIDYLYQLIDLKLCYKLIEYAYFDLFLFNLII